MTESKEDQKRGDVLKRMLKTPPRPRKLKPEITPKKEKKPAD
jgi:hypothetical protein